MYQLECELQELPKPITSIGASSCWAGSDLNPLSLLPSVALVRSSLRFLSVVRIVHCDCIAK